MPGQDYFPVSGLDDRGLSRHFEAIPKFRLMDAGL